MTAFAPPVIRSITLSPETIEAGVSIAAIVVWDGFPRSGVTYQWRRAAGPITGANDFIFTPTEAWDDLSCLVGIDNGRGTAAGASVRATIPTEPEPEPEPEPEEGIGTLVIGTTFEVS